MFLYIFLLGGALCKWYFQHWVTVFLHDLSCGVCMPVHHDKYSDSMFRRVLCDGQCYLLLAVHGRILLSYPSLSSSSLPHCHLQLGRSHSVHSVSGRLCLCVYHQRASSLQCRILQCWRSDRMQLV